MAEPMDLPNFDLSTKALTASVKRLLEHIRAAWPALNLTLDELEAQILHGALAIRDAATAAERQRAIAIVEQQPYYPDTHTGMRQQWVKDQILAALRGGDHE